MNEQGALWTPNGAATPLDEIPTLEPAAFQRSCLALLADGARLSALAAWSAEDPVPAHDVLAVLTHDRRGELGLMRLRLDDSRSYPALTPDAPQAQAFERCLFEAHGIRPHGHPWLKPLRRHADSALPDATEYPFFTIEGEGVHEVAVGPVHAGVIEPGHFRFQCAGEEVLHLEIQLGYQHRGVGALLRSASPTRRLAAAESIAGDTAVGHALAYCMVTEALAGITSPPAADLLRGAALELERLANHLGDLGALCGDVGYQPGASWFGRLRGDALNMLVDLSGNRFGRGLIRPGGVRFGLDASACGELRERLSDLRRDAVRVADLVFHEPSVTARFERAGTVTRRTAEALGLVGVVARASGCPRDVRSDHPTGAYSSARFEPVIELAGDVLARARVRWREVLATLVWLDQALAAPLAGSLASEPTSSLRPSQVAVALVEGWRGEIAHVLVTTPDGAPALHEVVDPSLHNWFGLAIALRGGQISDFPLSNKSFNLSYAGHDL